MPVEGAVDPALNAALDRIEDGSRNQNRDDHRPLAHSFRQALMNNFRSDRDNAKVPAEDQSRCQGIGNAALED